MYYNIGTTTSTRTSRTGVNVYFEVFSGITLNPSLEDMIIINFPSQYNLDYVEDEFKVDSSFTKGVNDETIHKSGLVYVNSFVENPSATSIFNLWLNNIENPYLEGQA
mmetsp:Transcript_17263/g.2857  ORF Transcript_17263/g.2857 Transcript_17263/m.2857 type:complete len:108 (+) Transcript_17263:3957-4280(+)